MRSPAPIQNISGLHQGTCLRLGGRLRMRRTDCEGGALVSGIRRREFVILLAGGVPAAWPVVSRAQQPGTMRRVGVLMGYAEEEPEAKVRLAGFRQGLEKLGWSEGRNVRIDYRYSSAATVEQVQELAKELVALQPEVILAPGTLIADGVQRETRAIPVVFLNVSDPIGSGFIASL